MQTRPVYPSPLGQFLAELTAVYGDSGVAEGANTDELDARATTSAVRYLHEMGFSEPIRDELGIFFAEVGHLAGFMHGRGLLYDDWGDATNLLFNKDEEPWHRVRMGYDLERVRLLNRVATDRERAENVIPFIRQYGVTPYLYFCVGYVRRLGQPGAASADMAYKEHSHASSTGGCDTTTGARWRK